MSEELFNGMTVQQLQDVFEKAATSFDGNDKTFYIGSGIKAVARAVVEATPWRNAKKSPPPHDVSCLVIASGIPQPFIAKYWQDLERWNISGSMVTHWMHLPELPTDIASEEKA